MFLHGETCDARREILIFFESKPMPKIKTKRAAAKRYKVLSSGKVRRNRANKQHILTKKNRKRLNKLKKPGYVHPSDMPLVKRCLPNG